MRTAGYHVALLLAAVLASGSALLTAGAASAQQQAIRATVTGAKIQKVGFRAMIQKEAIMYDLAGFARNKPDGTVEVRLKGDKDRIDQTLAAIRAGSKKSSQNNTGHSRMGSRFEDVHGLRLDIDQPEYHEPL
jgi:acylphosphatase